MFSKIFFKRGRRKKLIKLKNFNVGGKIILSDCRGHDTVIFFQIDEFRE